jgi:mannose-6-phosphate isomerase-like protein (cupin superfamily)
MTVIRGVDAPRFDLPGVRFTGFAAPSRDSAELCTWRLTVEASFVSPEAHTLDRDEIFMVTEGAVRLAPDGETIGAGDAAIVPAGSPIQLINAGDTVAEVIVAIPAGFTAKAADGSPIGTPPWAQ